MRADEVNARVKMRRANEMQQETSNDDVATGIPKKKESERRREAVRQRMVAMAVTATQPQPRSRSG